MFSDIYKFRSLRSCRRCQHGLKGGERTFARGGCPYGPGGELEHHKPARLHRDELRKETPDAKDKAAGEDGESAGRKPVPELPSHAREPEGSAGREPVLDTPTPTAPGADTLRRRLKPGSVWKGADEPIRQQLQGVAI